MKLISAPLTSTIASIVLVLGAGSASATGTGPAFSHSPTHGPVNTTITITNGGCSDEQLAGDAIALFRASDNALVSARVQLGNDPANRRPWSTTLSVTPTLLTPANVEQPTTPGAYVIALFCNIGSSFRFPGHSDPATTPATADLTKPFTVDTTASTPGAYQALSPTRLLDTRSGIGAAKTAVPAGGTLHLQVTGRGGIPTSGVSAVVLNVTATAPTAPGYVTAYADGTTRPTASNLNFTKGQTVPNLVLAPVGANGKVALFNGSSGTVQLIADSSGYFVAGTPTPPGSFGVLAPTRLLDTRSGIGAAKTAVPAGGTLHLQVTGRGGIPTSGVSAVVLNVTATAPTAPGYVTAYADGTTRPTASNLNFTKGQTVPNLVLAPVGANGKVALFNGSSGTVQLIADSSGYFRSP